jgi:hypothetical protein
MSPKQVQAYGDGECAEYRARNGEIARRPSDANNACNDRSKNTNGQDSGSCGIAPRRTQLAPFVTPGRFNAHFSMFPPEVQREQTKP